MTFTEYVMSFYGPGEIYGDVFNHTLTKEEVEVATKERKKNKALRFDGDSADREIVRDIMFRNRGKKKEELEHQAIIILGEKTESVKKEMTKTFGK